MANELREAIVLSIKTLRTQLWSQRRIARELGINRETVGRYLKSESDPAKAPTGSAAENGNSKPATSAEAPTGSTTTETPATRSLGEPFRESILSWLEQNLSAQRIYQDLITEYGFTGSYPSDFATVGREWRRPGIKWRSPTRN